MTVYQHEERHHEAVAAALPRLARDLREAQDAYLAKRGLDPMTARFNGWYPSRNAGDSSARIVIPASPPELGFWQARAMDPAEMKRYQSPHAPRENAVIVVYPSRLADRLVVVEGPMDALAATTTGGIGVALMGNTPPGICFDYIADRWPRAEAVVVPDKDAPEAGARWLAELTSRDLVVRLVLLPAKDLASLNVSARSEALR